MSSPRLNIRCQGRANLQPVLFVIVSEMIVDWLKHAFITKFNHVRASVYGRFTDVLAKDVLLAGSMTRRRKSSKGKGVRPILFSFGGLLSLLAAPNPA
jgi:hypothetical protein